MSGRQDPDSSSLAGRIAALDEKGALDTVAARMRDGDDPLSIIDECQRGMRYVGENYESRKYYISGLIMAGEIFREAMVILAPLLPQSTAQEGKSSVVLCTVQGDIHDLGKSLVTMMLRSYGIVVHDLGVDVAPEQVARCALELKPDLVGLSGLLTVATESMRATVTALREVSGQIGRPLPVIIGGGIVGEQTCRWTGADMWASDASTGVRLIREAIASRHA